MSAAGQDICVMRCIPNEINEHIHYHDFYTLVLVQSSNVSMQIGSRMESGLAGKAVLFQPHTLHAIFGPGNSKKPEYVIIVREELVRKKLLYLLADLPYLSEFFLNGLTEHRGDDLILDISDDPEILALARSIYEENRSASDGIAQQILEAQFLLLLMRLCRIRQKQGIGEKLSADRILSFISAHAGDVTLSGLAKYFNYHPNYITQLLREKTGRSFTAVKHYYQVRDACNLLEITSYSAQTVALMVGFENLQYFYRVFKKYMGLTPQEYRRQGILPQDDGAER